MHWQWKAMIGGLLVLATLACAFLAPASLPEMGVATIVAETLSAVTLAAPAPAITPVVPVGLAAAFPGGNIVIPTGIASGIGSATIPAVAGQADAPWWELAPEHLRITLQGYPLQGTFHEPQIIVLPATEYAALNESAAANIQILQGVLNNPGGVPDSTNLPHVAFFNAAPVFQSQVRVVPFQGGYGIRALTEYAQYTAPVNNNEMFYHFQGLTSDGRKYIIAVLPVTAPLLQADSAPSSVSPSGGVAFPDYANTDPAAFETYYNAISSLLNSTPAGDFAPSLIALDAFIGSLSVAP